MPIVEGCLNRLDIIDSPEGDALRAQLWKVTRSLQKGFRELGFDIGPAEACVTPVLVKAGVNSAANIAVALREEYHIFCSVVIYPVIPPGMVIFRIIPTAAHSMADVERTLAAFKDMKERLDRGEFDKEMPNMALLK
jgi:glycine C-acetyltransferase